LDLGPSLTPMSKATDQLLKDHKMVRKVLEQFSLDNPRFPEILKTLQRIVLAHAWFEDVIFLPAFKAEPLLERRFTAEIVQEHKDIDCLLKRLRKAPPLGSREMESLMLQFTSVLDAHFKKEEDALFPLAERILNEEGLNARGDEMERRKTEVRLPMQERCREA
jgi:hemerythrin-like domain-containing protein